MIKPQPSEPDARDRRTPFAVLGGFCRRHGLALVKLAIGIALLVIVIRQADVSRLTTLLSHTSLALFAAACIAYAAAITANAWRWQVVTRHLKPPIGMRDALVGSFEANFFNQILPSTIGGDPIKAVRAYDAGAKPSVALLGVLVDRAHGLWFIVASVVVLALVGNSGVVATPTFKVVGIVAAVATVGGAGVVAVGMLPLGDWLPRWLAPLAMLMSAFSALARTRSTALPLLASLVASNVTLIGAFHLCARALDVPLGIVDGALAIQTMLLAAMIPVSIGGWGLREGAAVLLLAGAGINATEATAAAILFGLVMTAVALVGGLVWALSPYRRITFADALDAVRQGRKRGIGGV